MFSRVFSGSTFLEFMRLNFETTKHWPTLNQHRAWLDVASWDPQKCQDHLPACPNSTFHGRWKSVFKGTSFAKGTGSGSPKACPPQIIDFFWLNNVKLTPHRLGWYRYGRSFGYRSLHIRNMATVCYRIFGFIWLYWLHMVILCSFLTGTAPPSSQVPGLHMVFRVFLLAAGQTKSCMAKRWWKTNRVWYNTI